MASRPDRAFRIADRRRPIFDGTGAFLYGGRWNSPGRRVIYAADTFAGALLEVLVHARIGAVPRAHAWIEISIPPDLAFEDLAPEELDGWADEESSSARAFGDRWHDERRSAILVVPSVVTSGIGNNVLINQDHPGFERLSATVPSEVVWDARLFHPPPARRNLISKQRASATRSPVQLR
jgi:RES domain-containing protein